MYAKDFAPRADGTPYLEIDPEVFTQTGGGRIKFSAYLRLYGDDKETPVEALGEEGDRWALLPKWTCDDKGHPMTLEAINAAIAAWHTRHTLTRSVRWADRKTVSSADWQSWASLLAPKRPARPPPSRVRRGRVGAAEPPRGATPSRILRWIDCCCCCCCCYWYYWDC